MVESPRKTSATDQNHGGSTMPGNVRAGCVDNMGQIDLGKNSSISFLPNSRFMNELAVIWPV